MPLLGLAEDVLLEAGRQLLGQPLDVGSQRAAARRVERRVHQRGVPATRTGSLRGDVTRLTQELATIFEGMIRRYPEQWHLYQANWPSDRS